MKKHGITGPTDKQALVYVAPKESNRKQYFLEEEGYIPSYLIIDTETEGLFQGKPVLGYAYELHPSGNIVTYITQAAPEKLPLDIFKDYDKDIIYLPLKEFWDMIYHYNGILIGANPLFDLARGAKAFDTSNAEPESMPTMYYDNITVKPVSFGYGTGITKYMYITEYATEDQPDKLIRPKKGKPYTRKGKKKGEKLKQRRIKIGKVLDVLQIANAVLGRPFSLKTLAATLGTDTQKQDIPLRHIGQNTETIPYLIADVKATFEAYFKLREIVGPDFDEIADKLFSAASLGKYTLARCGIMKPSHAAREECYEAYFGGRSEVNYIGDYPGKLWALDFFSQYPTLQLILNLSRFLLAKKITVHDVTKEVKGYLEGLTLEDAKDKAVWEKLSGYLVNVDSNGSRLPVRRVMDETGTINVYLPHVTLKNHWYSVFDYLSAGFSGKHPTINKIFEYRAEGKQEDIKDYNILGLHIKPETFFIDLLKQRVKLKEELKPLKKKEKKTKLTETEDQHKLNLEALIYGIKLILNATSYGASIERREKTVIEDVELNSTQGLYIFGKSLIEGSYTIPIIGVQITAAARLQTMIAEVIERKRTGHGLPQIDTDGFVAETKEEIQAFFQSFSPIPGKTYLEDDNDNRQLRFYGIAPKRYLKYMEDKDKGFVFVPSGMKEHGLGAYKIAERKIKVNGKIEKTDGRAMLVSAKFKEIKGIPQTQEEKDMLDELILLPIRADKNASAQQHPDILPFSFGMVTKGVPLTSVVPLYCWEDGDGEFYRKTKNGYEEVEEALFEDIKGGYLTKRDIIDKWFSYKGHKYIQPKSGIGWVTIDSITIDEKVPVTKHNTKGLVSTETAKIGIKKEERDTRTRQKEDRMLLKEAKKYYGLLSVLEQKRDIGDKDNRNKRGLTDKERTTITEVLEAKRLTNPKDPGYIPAKISFDKALLEQVKSTEQDRDKVFSSCGLSQGIISVLVKKMHKLALKVNALNLTSERGEDYMLKKISLWYSQDEYKGKTDKHLYSSFVKACGGETKKPSLDKIEQVCLSGWKETFFLATWKTEAINKQWEDTLKGGIKAI